MSSNLRQILQDCLHPLPNNITVGTSAGIDSASLVLSALDIGKQVSIISFTLEDRRSKDFLGAKKLADIFDLQFIPIFTSFCFILGFWPCEIHGFKTCKLLKHFPLHYFGIAHITDIAE